MDRDSKDDAIRNKSLIDQIDSLEDDNNAIKYEKKGKNTETLVIVGLLIIIIVAIILYGITENSSHIKQFEGNDIFGEATSKVEDNLNIKDINDLYDSLEDEFEITDDSTEYNDSEDFDYESYDDDYYYDDYYEEDYEYDSTEVLKEEFENQKKNLVIESEGFNIDNDLIVLFKNNNSEPLEGIDVYAVFFDGENNIVDIDTDMIGYLAKGSKFPLLFKTPKNFETYKIYSKKEFFFESNYEDFTDKIEFKTEVEKYPGDRIIINGKNNSDKKIEYIDFAIVFYDQNDKILDVSLETEYDIRKGQSFNIETWKPYNSKTYDDLEFSRCEVSIVGAYNYID